jgi:hypothetical protein
VAGVTGATPNYDGPIAFARQQTAIPTLSEWAFGLMALLLALYGAWTATRRSRATPRAA